MHLFLCIFFALLTTIFSSCEVSYLTFCDCIRDVNEYDVKNWTEVVIGAKNSQISKCLHTTLNKVTIGRLEQIRLLVVVNQFNEIDSNDTFEDVGQTLKFLKLYENNLKRVKSGTFSNFRKLSQLGLTHNGIQVLEKYSFKGSVIRNLDLSNNKLETIAEHTFDGGKIRNIVLRNNKICHINGNAFNEHLEVLHLDYNNIENLESDFAKNSPKLEEVSISNNKLSHIADVSKFHNIKKLDFSSNTINFINKEQFQDLKNLVYVDFTRNKLEEFSLKTFKKVKSENLTILLSYNLLTNIKIEKNSKPMTLTLFGNPWNCDCLSKMEERMIQNNFTRTRCDLELFKCGTVPICLHQGDCKDRPVQDRGDLRAFLRVVDRKRKDLPCDLFHDVGEKYVTLVQPPG